MRASRTIASSGRAVSRRSLHHRRSLAPYRHDGRIYRVAAYRTAGARRRRRVDTHLVGSQIDRPLPSRRRFTRARCPSVFRASPLPPRLGRVWIRSVVSLEMASARILERITRAIPGDPSDMQPHDHRPPAHPMAAHSRFHGRGTCLRATLARCAASQRSRVLPSLGSLGDDLCQFACCPRRSIARPARAPDRPASFVTKALTSPSAWGVARMRRGSRTAAGSALAGPSIPMSMSERSWASPRPDQALRRSSNALCHSWPSRLPLKNDFHARGYHSRRAKVAARRRSSRRRAGSISTA